MAEMRPKSDNQRIVSGHWFCSLLAGLAMVFAVRAQETARFDAELELERAIHLEAVTGDLAGAIHSYQAILAHKGSSKEIAARALLGLARCQEKLGRGAEARASYERLITGYSDQTSVASQARARLSFLEESLAGPRNLRFVEGVIGRVPPGWIVPALPKDADSMAEIRRTGCHTGLGCAIVRAPPNAPSPVASLMQSFNAATYKGRTVRLRAWLRLEAADPGDRAQMFVSVDRANHQTGFFDNMSDRPVRSPDWTFCEIVCPVDVDATFVNFGFLSIGKGAVWVDEVSFEILK
jgi:hypothetical protein